jgi:hypothetical protein
MPVHALGLKDGLFLELRPQVAVEPRPTPVERQRR